MARSSLMQKLIRLTRLAHEAKQKNVPVAEYAEQKMYNRRSFLQTSVKAALATTTLCGYSKLIDAHTGATLQV